jgi:hypothetical protein
LHFDSYRAEFVGEHIFQEWNNKQRPLEGADGTPLTVEKDENELMADVMDANPANLHKRKAIEIDGAESQAGSSHAAGDKRRKI